MSKKTGVQSEDQSFRAGNSLDEARFSFLIKRDLSLAALLLWMTPFCAALSSAFTATATACCADSGSFPWICFPALVM